MWQSGCTIARGVERCCVDPGRQPPLAQIHQRQRPEFISDGRSN
jgi:hypothetical protein